MNAADAALPVGDAHGSLARVEIEFQPEAGRFEGRRLAHDADWTPLRDGAGYDTLYEAPTLAGFWAMTVADVTGPLPAAPDFAAVEALSDRCLADGFSWGARLVDGVWTAECMDEVRGKWLYAFDGVSLESALASAIAWNDARRRWFEEVRRDWAVPEWLARARGEARARLAGRAPVPRAG